MRIPTIGLVFHSLMGYKGPYTSKVITAALLSCNENILTVFSTVFHYIQVFGSLQARSLGLGHCKWDINLRKIDISSSLSCNPATGRLDSAFNYLNVAFISYKLTMWD